jgi:hypothetical protein
VKTMMRVVAMMMCAGLAACATMVNPGRIAPSASPVGPTARVELRHARGLQAIYENGAPVAILDAADHDTHVSVCRTYRETGATPAGWVTVNADCMSWTLLPYIELAKSGSHSLRIVTDRGEATRTMNAHLHIQWFWLNGVWLAAAPVGWVVDVASGRMNYFGSLDIADAMGSAAAVPSRGTR